MEATLTAGGKTVTKTYGLTMTGGDFEVNLAATPRAWAYENDGAKTANRHTITLAASVANDSGGSTGYTYKWRAIPHPITGKALVLVSGGGESDAAATYAAPPAAAASKEPYVVACEVVGQDDLGLETGDALGASMVTVRLLGDASGDGMVTVTDFSIWKTQNGQTGQGLTGDFNGDGQVTVTDFSMWKVNNGQVVPE
ncbi:MAG: dockerin type I domain-containing protein [Phycisphaerae bacterium]